MSEEPDIIVYSPDRQLLLIVEVKKRAGASPEWATQMRRNLLVYSVIPRTPYFLLALPDYFYFWKDALSNHEAPPDYRIETKKALESYFDKTPFSLSDISEEGLELLVTSWLRYLTRADLSKEKTDPELQWLFDSGLHEAIKNGEVMVEAAA